MSWVPMLLAVAQLGPLAQLGPAPGPTPVERHAIVVAHNDAVDGEFEPLAYADDDGARWYELLTTAGVNVTLLSVLDAETQALHPRAASESRLPSSSELGVALKRTFAAIGRAREDGRRTEFYFIYVGHGSIAPSGEGAMHLHDRRFLRSELFAKILAPSPATMNHVLIDACHAYLMVARRGGSPALDRAIAGLLEREDLDAYPNTGVLLSTSRSKEVHEWSRYRAGIFSHQLRSALAGAADVDGDGSVGYAEAEAFVAAANARVTHPEAKLEIFVRPPRMREDAVLLSREWAPEAPTVRIPPKLAGRWWLEDDRGVRYADLHASPGESVELLLVPQSAYVLQDGASRIVLPLDVVRTADAGAFARVPTEVVARGSTLLAFQRDLFAVPFGRAWYEGFAASRRPDRLGLKMSRPSEPSSVRPAVGVSLLVLGAGAAIAGMVFGLEAEQAASDHRTAIGTRAEVQGLRSLADERATIAHVLFLSAGLLAGAGALTLVW